MRPLDPGAEGRWQVVPGADDTAAAIGNTGVVVVSSQALIGFLEQASHLAVCQAFEPGEISVGVRVAVDHVGPAYAGQAVDCHARLTAVDGHRLTFAVTATQDGRQVMTGTHVRAVVELERFLAAMPKVPASDERLSFWFDFHSPWCYLAAEHIEDLAARHGLCLEWRPVHLARLNAAIGGRRPLEENPAFVAWYKQDLQDWAALQGLQVRYHPDYPLRPARALRAALYAIDRGQAGPFVRRVMRAYWREGRDISDLAELASLATEAGLEAAAASEAAVSEGYKARLATNTEVAIAAGLFGVPSFVFRGKLFFGNDRLAMLEAHIAAPPAE